MYLRNGKIGVIDLETGESSEEEMISDSASSIRVSRDLLDKFGPESMVLGTGLLTGSLIPASCAGTIVAGKKTMPLLGYAGIELKLSGFDFLVVNGRASKTGYVWARDGIVEFVELASAARINSWQRTDKIRADQGDSKIQVVSAGPWCDAVNPASQLIIDHWGGEDKVGMGAEFGKRNLTAVAFRGMGELEVAEPETHFSKCVSLIRNHLSKLGPNMGLSSYYEGARKEDFASLVHRSVGCYGCPFPCRTFVKTEEDPKEMRLMHREPGYLHYDIPALARAAELGLSALDAARVFVRCAQAGAEPVAVLNACSAKRDRVDANMIERLMVTPTEIEVSFKGNFEASFQDKHDYESSLGLGLCPRYWSKVGYDIDSLSSCIESALGSKLPSVD